MCVHVSSYVTPSRSQWKSQISAVIGHEGHDCNVLSLFTNSKLFQRLLCIGVGSNDLCKLQLGTDGGLAPTSDSDDRWLASLNGRNINSKSTHSSDTEAMEYEDIDRYLVTVDSAAVAKDMMERRPTSNSASKLTRPRRQHGLCYDEQSPSPSYKDHDPDYSVGQKLSLKIKRRYTKRKKMKQNGPSSASDVKEEMDGDGVKIQRNRVVKIIDPGVRL